LDNQVNIEKSYIVDEGFIKSIVCPASSSLLLLGAMHSRALVTTQYLGYSPVLSGRFHIRPSHRSIAVCSAAMTAFSFLAVSFRQSFRTAAVSETRIFRLAGSAPGIQSSSDYHLYII
jgi:hypothetical protein